MGKMLVTGGCGYIGSHTMVDLVAHGIPVISIDNNSRSDATVLRGVEAITGQKIKNYQTDLCDREMTRRVFSENPGIESIIHFAAFKSVPESVREPALYYRNNILSLLNLLECVDDFGVKNFVFSSSCSVYGNTRELPVTENTPLGEAESPYGYTKQVGERIVSDISKVSGRRYVMLRYFNPVGAHRSALIGEVPYGPPENLVPVITQTAAGKINKMTVFGDDYDTRDGSCVRDFIHVMDIAHAHTLAVQYLEREGPPGCEIFNLGTGNGVTVLEAIKAFEKVSGKKLNYSIGPRRPGDVAAIYANNDLAFNKLGWKAARTLEEMMSSAWEWERKLG